MPRRRAAIETIQRDAGERSGEDRRHGARQHHTADDEPRVRGLEGQAENGDVVEVIADFADDLSDPGRSIVTVLAQQRVETGHQEAAD